MFPKKIRNHALLVLAALIWGAAFVAQRTGGDAVGAFTFNGVRSLCGSAVLALGILFRNLLGHPGEKPKTKEEKKLLWLAGGSCGIVLCAATNLQQVGINMGTPAGKAGFLTACYIILVPILGLFLKKKCSIFAAVGVLLSVCGLYLLCMHGKLSFQLPDVLILLCALMFAVHILVIDRFSGRVDPIRMSCIQFLVSGTISCIIMIFTETGHTPEEVKAWAQAFSEPGALIAILYAGICSCGIAYTLQIIGQREVNPTVASLLMSLESVFSVLAGALILGERMSLREICGCLLIFSAVVLAQIPQKTN